MCEVSIKVKKKDIGLDTRVMTNCYEVFTFSLEIMSPVMQRTLKNISTLKVRSTLQVK